MYELSSYWLLGWVFACLLAWIKRHVLCTSCVCLITRSLRISSTKRNVGWGSQSPVRWTDIMVSLFFGSCRPPPSPIQKQRPPPKNHTFLKSFTKVLFLMRSCSPRPSRSCYHHFNMETQRNWVHKTQFTWAWIQIDMETTNVELRTTTIRNHLNNIHSMSPWSNMCMHSYRITTPLFGGGVHDG